MIPKESITKRRRGGKSELRTGGKGGKGEKGDRVRRGNEGKE